MPVGPGISTPSTVGGMPLNANPPALAYPSEGEYIVTATPPDTSTPGEAIDPAAGIEWGTITRYDIEVPKAAPTDDVASSLYLKGSDPDATYYWVWITNAFTTNSIDFVWGTTSIYFPYEEIYAYLYQFIATIPSDSFANLNPDLAGVFQAFAIAISNAGGGIVDLSSLQDILNNLNDVELVDIGINLGGLPIYRIASFRRLADPEDEFINYKDSLETVFKGQFQQDIYNTDFVINRGVSVKNQYITLRLSLIQNIQAIQQLIEYAENFGGGLVEELTKLLNVLQQSLAKVEEKLKQLGVVF